MHDKCLIDIAIQLATFKEEYISHTIVCNTMHICMHAIIDTNDRTQLNHIFMLSRVADN